MKTKGMKKSVANKKSTSFEVLFLDMSYNNYYSPNLRRTNAVTVASLSASCMY